MEFTVKPEHIKLLQHMYVGWNDCEFGAPEIDPKRPYGNSSVISDIRDILGFKIKKCPHCDEPLEEYEGEDQILEKLHKETQVVLQIFLQTGKMETGKYKKLSEYGIDWEKV